MSDEPEVSATDVLDTPTVIVAKRQIFAKRAARQAQTLPVELLTLDRSNIQIENTSISPGVAILIVTTDPERMSALRHNIGNGRYEQLDESIKRIMASSTELNRSDYAPTSDAAHIVDVAIGSRRLAENLLLEDRASYAETFPFMGGEIDSEHMKMVDYSSPEASECVDAILILSQPDLTQIERAVLSALPGNREALVGKGAVAALPGIALGVWAAYRVGKYLYREYKQTKAWRESRRASRGIAPRLGGDEPAGRADIPARARVSELLEARDILLRAQSKKTD